MSQHDVQSTSRVFTLVEHPAVIKNVEKGLETLGGMDAIEKAFSGGQQLELKHRPGNQYQNGIVGEKRNMEAGMSGLMHLVFKVRRKKKSPNVCETECLGLVKDVYAFKSMADFQFLPIRRMETKKGGEPVYEDLVPRLIPTDIQSSFSWWTHKEPEGEAVPRFLPPYLFSRYSSGASNKILSHEVDRPEQTKVSHGQNLRSERKAFTLTLQHSDVFPEKPSEQAVQDVDSRCKNQEPHRIIKELFDRRPMWNRVAIQCQSGLDETLLKVIMAKYAFYILSGPWGRLWCRFGYDPRKIPDAKQFQTVMVSFRKHQKIPERTKRLKVSYGENKAAPRTGEEDYVYTPGLLPAVRQMWYSVCDIQLPAAQKVLRPDYYGTLPVVDPATGWFSLETIRNIRSAIKEDVRRTSKQLEETDPDLADLAGSESDTSDQNELDSSIDMEDW